MELKYIVKGIVKNSFIIRGLHFPIGSDIELRVSENELNFIKERCEYNFNIKTINENDKISLNDIQKNKINKVGGNNESKRPNKVKYKTNI